MTGKVLFIELRQVFIIIHVHYHSYAEPYVKKIIRNQITSFFITVDQKVSDVVYEEE